MLLMLLYTEKESKCSECSLENCANWSLLQKVALSFDFNEFDDEVDEDDELSGTNSPVHDVHEHTQPVVGIASCVIVIIILQRLTHHVLVIRMTNRRRCLLFSCISQSPLLYLYKQTTFDDPYRCFIMYILMEFTHIHKQKKKYISIVTLSAK